MKSFSSVALLALLSVFSSPAMADLVAPPSDGSRNSVTVNGRTYTSQPGVAIDVPSFDAQILLSNKWVVGSVPPVVVPPDEQIVANRGIFNWFSNSAGGGGTNYTRGEYRQKLTFGPAASSDIRICYGNYYSNGGPGEVAGLNAITVEGAVELTSPVTTVMASWSGAKTITIQLGTQVCSDPLPIDMPANGTAWLRTGVTVSSGQFWPTANYFFSGSGDAYYESTSATSQIGNTGALVLPSGGAQSPSNTGFGALAILGRPKTKIRSGVIVGDSIAIGVADTGNGDGLGNVGFISRSLAANSIPYSRLGRQSETLQSEAGAAGYLRRLYFRNATIAITNAATNDIPTGRTLAQLQGDLTTLWAALKARNLKVHHVLVFPRTTSTDSFATPGNQSYYSAAYAPGGIKDQLNAWIKTQVGILIDGYFDPAPYIEDAANPGKWATVASPAALYTPTGAMTTDGTHPVALSTTALTTPFTAYLAGL